MRFEYLVIGNSAAGVGAAEAIRRLIDGSIGMISEEDNPPYSRPFIGHLLTGRDTFEDILYRQPNFYRKNEIEFFGGVTATRLDVQRRVVELSDGRKIGFEKLLIATGGNPIMPPIPGLRECGYTFTKASDVLAIKERVDSGEVQKAVVLGGGLIGIAATAALSERGVQTTIIELAPRILSSILDEDASQLVQSMVDERGVTTITSHTVGRVEGERESPKPILDTGEPLEADLFIVAIGVRPRIDLVSQTPIKTDRGIMVDQRMSTNVDSIYAAGDCAQIYDFVREANVVLAIWPTAYIGGMIAGNNMASNPVQSNWGTSMNAMSYFDRPVLSAGLYKPPDGQEGWIQVRAKDGGTYRKVVLRDGRIKGFILVGDVDKAGILLQLMRSSVRIKNPEELLSPDFGYAKLPSRERKRVWKEAGKIATP